jgi:uncharacterized phage protein (TIGR01671 family)
MRKISFRAWHKEAERMLTVDILDNLNKQIYHPQDLSNGRTYTCNPVNPEPPDPETYSDFDQIELMQFTGLHDKNGREIYEGDILKANAGLYEDRQDYIVEWMEDGAAFWLKCVDGGSLHCGLSIEDVEVLQLEVIGNIYETPEFLQPPQ